MKTTKSMLIAVALAGLGRNAFGQDANTVLVNVGVSALGAVFMKCFALGVIVVVALIAKRYLTAASDDDIPGHTYRGRIKRMVDRHNYNAGSYQRSDCRRRNDDEED